MFKKNRFHFFADNYVMVIFCLTTVWLLSIHFNRYTIHGFKYQFAGNRLLYVSVIYTCNTAKQY